AFYMGSFILAVLGVFVTGSSLQAESDSGLLHAIVSKPIRRFEITAGKWLGAAIFLTVYVALLTAGIMLAVGLNSGYYPPNPLPAAALLVLEALVMLSLRLLFGAFLGTMVSGIV